jgi:hypothetical protein
MNTLSESTPLTPKQERFAQEYLVDLNATQAAVRAGYSANSARQEGTRLLSKVSIQQAIYNLKPDNIPTPEDVLNNLEQLRRDCMEKDGNGKPIDASTAARCLELQGRFNNLWNREPETSDERIIVNILLN